MSLHAPAWISGPVMHVTCCRVCGGTRFAPILDLGRQCLATSFHRRGEPPRLRAPLELVRCEECCLVQLAHAVDPDLMFRSCWDRSGTNDTRRTHLRKVFSRARARTALRPGDTVIDVGSNDGTGLRCYPQGVRTIGVDPSDIEPDGASAHVRGYFSYDSVAAVLAGRQARILTSIAMFDHVSDPRAFARDVARCLADDGIWVLELSYLPAIMEHAAYDLICHERVAFYRLATFERMLEGTGLDPFDAELDGYKGGSLRLYVAPSGAVRPTERLRRLRAGEARGGFDDQAPYLRFRSRVEQVRAELLAFLRAARAQGRTVYGYGASTSGMVALQCCGATAGQITAIAERDARKIGLHTPGTDIPICSEEGMRAARPDYLLALPWHFLDEFRSREQDYLEGGGSLVAPLPRFTIHSAAAVPG